jgi:hypothetical protein
VGFGWRAVLQHRARPTVVVELEVEPRAESATGRGMLIEKFAVTTPPETTPVDFGRAMHAEALRRGLGRAKTVYLVMDVAAWLWELDKGRLAHAVKSLDFHHARDHLWALAHALHSQDCPAAREWVQPFMRSLRNGRENKWSDASKSTSKGIIPNTRSTARKHRRRNQLLPQPSHHLPYQTIESQRAPRGREAIKSLGKRFQQRLHGCGQIWRRKGMTSIVRPGKNAADSYLWK